MKTEKRTSRERKVWVQRNWTQHLRAGERSFSKKVRPEGLRVAQTKRKERAFQEWKWHGERLGCEGIWHI